MQNQNYSNIIFCEWWYVQFRNTRTIHKIELSNMWFSFWLWLIKVQNRVLLKHQMWIGIKLIDILKYKLDCSCEYVSILKSDLLYLWTKVNP